jgi:predicted MFS family arabinose efflux permease
MKFREAVDPKEPSLWRAIICGFCTSFAGIGLSRFAYTPLIPALIVAKWFTPSQAIYLGAANLAGYLAGVLLARPAAARTGAPFLLRAMMITTSAAFFACAIQLPFLWFFTWRFVSGASGGVLMVLAAPAVLPHVAPARRGLASGIIFTGIGAGAATAGLVMPLLLMLGIVQAWIGLGLLSALLTAVSWRGWPNAGRFTKMEAKATPRTGPVPLNPALKALCIEYGLGAIGLVPHMVFLVDFVARGLDRGVDAGAHYWVLFGLGAAAGPVIVGYIADRTGFSAALRGAFLLQAGAVGLLMIYAGSVALAASSIIVGAFIPGLVTLVLGRSHELVPSHDVEAQSRAWSLCTLAFALCQAAGAYGFSYLFKVTGGGYPILFELGAAVFLLALVIDLHVPLADGRLECPAPQKRDLRERPGRN